MTVDELAQCIDECQYVFMSARARARPEGCCPLLPVPALREAQRAPLVQALKALADPTRLEIVRLLGAQPGATCVCDVVSHFALAQPTISHHLRILEESGLVVGERRGIWSYYALAPDALAGLADVLSALAAQPRAAAAS
jgi:ArsR family transcriptional regulator